MRKRDFPGRISTSRIEESSGLFRVSGFAIKRSAKSSR
jgi:hypothetical protein